MQWILYWKPSKAAQRTIETGWKNDDLSICIDHSHNSTRNKDASSHLEDVSRYLAKALNQMIVGSDWLPPVHIKQ